MITPTFKAKTAGKNCTFAIHPNHAAIMPVKSKNSNVINDRNAIANIVLIFRNMMFGYLSVLIILIHHSIFYRSLPGFHPILLFSISLFYFDKYVSVTIDLLFQSIL